MLNSAKLRQATKADGPAVNALITEILTEYGLDLEQAQASEFDRGPADQAVGVFMVLEHGGQIVGCYGLKPLDSKVCELRRLYLKAELRGQGLGRLLLTDALKQARTLGFASIELNTSPRMQAARKLYQRQGFMACETSDSSCCSEKLWLKL